MAGASVSGPGALSKRTDRGPAQKIRDLPDAQYGEAATYRDLQQQAPLSQTPGPTPAPKPRGKPGKPGANVVPFGVPTQNPDEPVTAGAAQGAGPGPEIMAPSQTPAVKSYTSARDLVESLAKSQPDNPALAYLANSLGNRF